MSRFAIVGARGYPSSYGGFETLVHHLAPYLVAQGHTVVVYGRANSRHSYRETINGVEVRKMRGLDFKATSTLSFGFSASWDLANDPCDAALILNIANGFYLRRLSRANIATCVNVDGLEWHRGKWGPLARRTLRHAATLTARDADALVFDSSALGSIWRDLFGREGHVISYGAPILVGGDNRRLRGLGLPYKGYVLAVARIVPENNVDLLLDALPYLTRDTRIVVVGDSNYEHATIRRLRRLKADGRINWLGHVDDQELLNELWMNAGAYWHGHSVGGTNPALLQALGAGAPTLALDTPFNREVIERDAQLVPHDASVLATRITALLESPALARSSREWGREVVRERYHWEGVCERYERLLEQLAEARRPKVHTSLSRAQAPVHRPATRVLIRSRQPSRVESRGKVVVVVGPDGAGKSRLTTELQEVLGARLGVRVSVVNFRSGYLDKLVRKQSDGRATARAALRPHMTPARGLMAASAKAVALWVDLLWSSWSWRRSGRSNITLVERYAYDLVVDPARLGLGRAPEWLRELAIRLVPAPDVILMCQAPAPILRARKAELDEGEISRQYKAWSVLREAIDVPFIEVETTTPVDADHLAGRILAAIDE